MTNEALCQLSYEAPNLGPEESTPGSHTQEINSIIMSGIAPKQNTFKFKIATRQQKYTIKTLLGMKMGPLANGALCLSIHKHNGKSGTELNVYLQISIACSTIGTGATTYDYHW